MSQPFTRKVSLVLAFALLAASFAMAQKQTEDNPRKVDLKLDQRFEVQTAVVEGLVDKPLALQFDKQGRMWVVESTDFRFHNGRFIDTNSVGRIVCLEDEDGDGVMDKSVVFLDQLRTPRSVLPIEDGVLVLADGKLMFWRDTDHDGKGDSHELVIDSLDGGQTLGPNALTWSIDGWIEMAASSQKVRYEKGKWIREVTHPKGHWGLSQDDAGRWFYNEPLDQVKVDLFEASLVNRNARFFGNSGTLNQSISDSQKLWIRHESTPDRPLEELEFVSACSPLVYRAALLPLDFYTNVLVCDPIHGVIRRNQISVDNTVIRAKNAEKDTEFLRSSHSDFSPVYLSLGPDGAIYLVDRGNIGADPSKEKKFKGRILRIVPKGYQYKTFEFPQSDREWIGFLGHANALLRSFAQQTLISSKEVVIEEDLRVALQSQENLIRRLHAMWVLHARDSLTPRDLQPLCFDVDFKVRSGAIQILGSLAQRDESERSAALKQLLALRTDSSDYVEVQKMLALGRYDDNQAIEAKWKMLSSNPDAPWMMETFYAYDSSSLDLKWIEFLSKPANSKKSLKVLRTSIIQQLSFQVWSRQELEYVEAWLKTYLKLAEKVGKETDGAQETRLSMQKGFEHWLLHQSPSSRWQKKPQGFDDFISEFTESFQELALKMIQFDR